MVLAWAVRRPGGATAGPVGSALPRLALVAVAWYSAAAVASSLWSVYPSATLWRSVVYLGLVLLAVALAGLTDDELSTALVLLAGVAVAGSLLLIALDRGLGTDDRGDWIGMYTNRNSLAPLAALGVIGGLHWLLPRADVRLPGTGGAWGGSAGGGVAGDPGRRRQPHSLVGAGGRTGLGLGVRRGGRVRPGCARLAAVEGPGPPRLAGGWWPLGVGVAVVAAAWDVPTFLQRRTIWGLVWDRVLERPWGGYGFFAFWEVPELVAEHLLLERGSAHNSLVETALGLGVAGTLPFVVLVVLAAVNAGRGLWLRPSAGTGMWAAVTLFVLIENVTESFVLWFSHIWVLLLAAALRRPIADAES